MSAPDPLIAALIEERRRQGISQRELGRRAGLSSGGLCEVERGDHSPTLRNLRLLAAALGFDVNLTTAAPTTESKEDDHA
ncbi:helix-turn-helix transcriptional regulator [Nocardioides sp. WS12]|uniref:helix-turn-helix domain-containing protein n=1 Tax=Nocardioides sp. WS12 TaxID=2486272 RepID=UPI0015FE15CC|nr:helix-turn-helix transcriptional regulator [Nocardioides sp. WS12]